MKIAYTFPSLGDWEQARRPVLDFFQQTARAVNNADFGSTTGRPISTPGQPLTVGQFYFDTTLNKPVWWSEAGWRDATGTLV